MFEAVADLFNAHPLLWVMYGFLITVPVVAIVSYFFWPKDSDAVGHRKKTDAPSPDTEVKDNISDSGIEASGETERSPSSDGDLSPLSILHPDSPLESDSGVNAVPPAATQPQDESHDNHVTSVTSTDDISVEEDRRNGKPRVEQNGGVVTEPEDDTQESPQEEEEGSDATPRWSFPPVLEDFDLMSSDIDPSQLEEIFADKRLIQVNCRITPGGPGLGISIAGGYGCPLGDLPIVIKRVLPSGLAENDGQVKSGDELVAVNETLLVGTTKDFAVEHLSKLKGDVRLLVLQDE